MKRKLNDLSALGGMVYSTDPNADLSPPPADEPETLAPARQDLRMTLNKRLRGGKVATVVYQFVGREADLELLGKALKTHCGVGGSVKDGEILLQGDCLRKAGEYLQKHGYRYKLAGV
jgi:translation initiation factor 1